MASIQWSRDQLIAEILSLLADIIDVCGQLQWSRDQLIAEMT